MRRRDFGRGLLGLTEVLGADDSLGDLANEEFMLNIYDEYTDGETILWDESHGQFDGLGSFKNFEAYAEDNGYTVESTDDISGLREAIDDFQQGSIRINLLRDVIVAFQTEEPVA